MRSSFMGLVRGQLSGGKVRNKYGRTYADWRKATKRAWGSRTYARHRYGRD
jgi:hypothetical protein